MERDLEKAYVFYLKEDEKGFRLIEEEDYIREREEEFKKRFMSDYIEYISSTEPVQDNSIGAGLFGKKTITDLAALLSRYPATARSYESDPNEWAISLDNSSSMDNEVDEQKNIL